MPGERKVGQLLPEIQEKVGFDLEVVLCGSHDTASAVMAVPLGQKGTAFISARGPGLSWGIESLKPVITEDAAAPTLPTRAVTITGSGFLKNIMGLWMIQST